MTNTDTERPEAHGDDQAVAELAESVRRDPFNINRMAPELHCGDLLRERRAARACALLAHTTPQVLQPALGRMLRIANATEDEVMRLALADALPRLQMSSAEAGRLAFVFEAWLEGTSPVLQRQVMDAMVALIPQRPALARRIRTVIERRAALGSPTAARHGMALLETLKEF